MRQIWTDVTKALGFGGATTRRKPKRAGEKEPALGALKPKLKVKAKLKAKPRRPRKAETAPAQAKKKKASGRKSKR